eukprot:13534967-Alexandrium_andersonii.AAC.1
MNGSSSYLPPSSSGPAAGRPVGFRCRGASTGKSFAGLEMRRLSSTGFERTAAGAAAAGAAPGRGPPKSPSPRSRAAASRQPLFY